MKPIRIPESRSAGRQNLAQHVSAGKLEVERKSPGGATEILLREFPEFYSFAPTGLARKRFVFPGLKPWARIYRASGAVGW